jgi:hypothetical protein
VSFPMHGRELPAARSYTGGLWRTGVVPRGREPFGYGPVAVMCLVHSTAKPERTDRLMSSAASKIWRDLFLSSAGNAQPRWQRPALQQGDDKRRRGAKHRGDEAPTNLGQLAIEGDDFLPQNAVVVREALNRGT